MRKIFAILTLTLIAVTMYYLRTVENQSHIHIISLLKYHYVVETIKDSIHVPIFISNKETDLTNKSQFDRIQINNQSITLDLQLLDIVYSHQETYLDITYNVFNFQLKFPILNQYVYIEEASIDIVLVEGIKHTFLIGAVEIMGNEETFESDWEDIYALRYEDTLSIKSLQVVSSKQLDIMISPMIKSHLTLDNQTYRVHIALDALLYWDIPLRLYANSQVEMIIGVHWISSKRILSQTEGYHVTYDMYRTESRQTL